MISLKSLDNNLLKLISYSVMTFLVIFICGYLIFNNKKGIEINKVLCFSVIFTLICLVVFKNNNDDKLSEGFNNHTESIEVISTTIRNIKDTKIYVQFYYDGLWKNQILYLDLQGESKLEDFTKTFTLNKIPKKIRFLLNDDIKAWLFNKITVKIRDKTIKLLDTLKELKTFSSDPPVYLDFDLPEFDDKNEFYEEEEDEILAEPLKEHKAKEHKAKEHKAKEHKEKERPKAQTSSNKPNLSKKVLVLDDGILQSELKGVGNIFAPRIIVKNKENTNKNNVAKSNNSSNSTNSRNLQHSNSNLNNKNNKSEDSCKNYLEPKKVNFGNFNKCSTKVKCYDPKLDDMIENNLKEKSFYPGYTYMPPSNWEGGGKKTPVCAVQRKCLKKPPSLNNLYPHPHEYSGVGSILPRFSFKQEYEFDSSCPAIITGKEQQIEES